MDHQHMLNKKESIAAGMREDKSATSATAVRPWPMNWNPKKNDKQQIRVPYEVEELSKNLRESVVAGMAEQSGRKDKQQIRVTYEVEELSKKIDILRHGVEELNIKLELVSSPPAELIKNPILKEDSSSVPLINMLREQRYEIDATCAFIDDIIRRLAI